MSDEDQPIQKTHIEPYGHIVLARLNYEWRQIVDIIKHIPDNTWDEVYTNIQEYLQQILEDEVHISSEYMIFDNCIRQAIPWLIVAYNNIVDYYKQILGLSMYISVEQLKEQIYAYGEIDYFDAKLREIDQYLNQPNFNLCVDNLIIMEDLDIDPDIIHEIHIYVEALYTHRIFIPNSESDAVSLDDIIRLISERKNMN